MVAGELMQLQEELEFLLQSLGPVDFIRTLILQSNGAQVLAHDALTLPDGRRATRFVFVDGEGGEALLTVTSAPREGQAPAYSLCLEPRPHA